MKLTDKIHPELLDEVEHELEIRAEYPDQGEMIVPMHLMRRMQFALRWAYDEVAQLREDLHGAQGAVNGLTTDLLLAEADVWRLVEQTATMSHWQREQVPA